MENTPLVPPSAAAAVPSPDTAVAVKAPEAIAPVAVETKPATVKTPEAVVPVAVGVTPPQQPQLAPEPNCTLVGTKLTIHPQPNEVGYDVIVIKDGDNEEMIGKRKLDLIMPGSALVIENLFDDKEMCWLKSPENGRSAYVIRVFAVNRTGVQSAPKSFLPMGFLFPKGLGTSGVAIAGGQPTPPSTVTPPVEPKTEKVPTPVVVLSPEDKTALNVIPARLNKIDRDLGALPKERNLAWGMLRDMSNALGEISAFLIRLEVFENPGTNIADLLAQVKKLNDRVENTRALRSDKWNKELHPCLMKIKKLLESIKRDPGTPGESLFDEVRTIIGIVSNTDPGMTMTDIHSVLPRCREILGDLEELSATERAAAADRLAADSKAQIEAERVKAEAAEKAEAAAKAKADAEAAKAKAEAETKAEAEAKAKAEAAAQAESEKALLLAKVQALLAEKLEMQERAEAEARAKAEADAAKAKAEAERVKADAEAKAKAEAAAKTTQATAVAATPQPTWWARNKKRIIIGAVVGFVLGNLWGIWFFNRPSNSGSASKPTAAPTMIDQMSSPTPAGPTPATFPTVTPGTNDVTGQILAELATLRKEIRGSTQSTNPTVKLPERFTAKAQGNNNRNVGIGYNNGTIVGGDLIQNYYGSATPTPGMTSIPSGLSCQPKADGSYYWEKVLHAGESIGYKVSKGFVLCPRYSARKSELVIEVKGQDGQWKVVPTGEMLGNLQGSECRFTMKTTATETAELSFKLVPVANPKP